MFHRVNLLMQGNESPSLDVVDDLVTSKQQSCSQCIGHACTEPRNSFDYAQAMKAQALTLLATWVVADSSHVVAGRIRQQDLPSRILEDLVNRAHQFLPGPHGQMAVQVSLPYPTSVHCSIVVHGTTCMGIG